jgi:glucose/arabinose dehydrogenase
MKWTTLALLICITGLVQGAEFQLNKGDHICIVGGTVAERMQHYGSLETILHSRFPSHELVLRNLAYSADEVNGFRDKNARLRSRDFGTFDQWLEGSAPCPQVDKLSPRDAGKVRENRFELTNTKADVIFAFYGYGESFAGEAGLAAFRENVAAFIDHVASKNYNGKSAPRLVLFSPIAQEYIADPNLPTKDYVIARNSQLSAYSSAMAEIAKAKNVTFVDIFSSTLGERAVGQSLTINGVHQNALGDQAIAVACEKGLFGNSKAVANVDKLRKSVNDKNFYWYNRYRVTDGYSTYGDRAFLKFSEGPGGYGDGLSNYSVGQRELDILDVKTSNRDKVVWATAQGKDLKADDTNIPELIPVISNKPGPLESGKHEFLTGEQSIEKMTVHKNMKVELFAEESKFPEMVNPVQMAFDTKGRLWVAVWPTYPHWKPTEPMADKLLILEDTNNDGKADICKTFAGDIHNPTGFEFWGGGVLVAQGPDILFLKDTNGDDKYDVKERIIHGLDTADTHHTSNSFALEPGGAVYFQEGTFHHTQVETPWGASRRVANGAVFRYEPRTQKFDVYVSFGFANPHGHAFEPWGQDFVYDGTGAQPYHALLFSGDLDYPRKHGRPPQVYQQRTRPCAGVEILSSSHFPEEHRGNLLVLNVIGFQGVLQYKLEEKESSFSATEVEPIVSSSDVNFRPADIEVAPDGSIYFADWHNPIIGHMQHNLRDPSRDRNHGRVYRVRYEGRELLKPVPVADQPIDKLLTLLESKDDRVRHRARIELSARPTDKVIAATKAWMTGLNKSDENYQHHRMEGLWLHQSHNVINEELLKQMLKSPEPRARAAATRIVAYWRDRVKNPLELLQASVNDENPRVRLQAIWGLSYFNGAEAEKAAEIAAESLIYDQDEYIKHVFKETNDNSLEPRIKAFKGK